MFGGEQEVGLRPGSENFPGMVGLAVACDKRLEQFNIATKHMSDLRDLFEKMILEQIKNIEINAIDSPRVCNTSNIKFTGVDGQALLAYLDRKGILCSQTSACSSSRPEPSHVLLAMKLSEDDAFSSLRFSFSVLNSKSEVEIAVEAICRGVSHLRGVMKL